MWTLLLLVFSLICAVVPMVSYLGIMWWLDRYDREPLWLVGLTFLWGAVGAVFLALIGNFIGITGLTILLGSAAAGNLGPVIIAPLVEEPTKALGLLFTSRSRHFDNITDGFVYGAAAGLGFGMTENFFYFSSVGAQGDLLAWMGTVVVRTLFSALMHAGATSCVGAALGWARGRGALAHGLAIPVGFGIAMGMHALWNGLLTLDAVNEMNGRLTFLDLALFPLEFGLLVVIYQVCLGLESRLIRRELGEEASGGLLPDAHVEVLGSTLRRSRPGWLARGVPQDAYVQTATRLAFRKAQARSARAAARPMLEAEITRLRGEIGALLALGRG